ncbi:hypothetical protein [Luteolibacter soli]|uniref:Uncharacterized protein n=1 Tax=Luteolibacter soli TaxID=3135280 RepID=A0ABU9AVK1_9BACT
MTNPFPNDSTGHYPQGSFSTVQQDTARFEVQKPRREMVEDWFCGPLSEMSKDRHSAFVVMMVSIALYEKYLRYSTAMKEGDKFSDSAKAFELMASEFGIKKEDCFGFWQDWRNGLLHKAMPKIERFPGGYEMSGDFERALHVKGDKLEINPWKFRDVVVEKIRSNGKMWNDEESPLAKIVKITKVK